MVRFAYGDGMDMFGPEVDGILHYIPIHICRWLHAIFLVPIKCRCNVDGVFEFFQDLPIFGSFFGLKSPASPSDGQVPFPAAGSVWPRWTWSWKNWRKESQLKAAWQQKWWFNQEHCGKNWGVDQQKKNSRIHHVRTLANSIKLNCKEHQRTIHCK